MLELPEGVESTFRFILMRRAAPSSSSAARGLASSPVTSSRRRCPGELRATWSVRPVTPESMRCCASRSSRQGEGGHTLAVLATRGRCRRGRRGARVEEEELDEFEDDSKARPRRRGARERTASRSPRPTSCSCPPRVGVPAGRARRSAGCCLRPSRCSGCCQAGCRVTDLTRNAARFVTPRTFAVRRARSPSSLWPSRRARIDHTDLSRVADLLLVAPATANCSQDGRRRGDDALTTYAWPIAGRWSWRRR